MQDRRIVPLVAAIAGLALVGALAPEIYRGTFSDLDTFARAAGLLLGLGLWVLLARRFIPNRAVGAAAAAVPVLAVLWLVLWPYVRPATEVDEAFPVVTTPTPSTTVPTSTSLATTAPDANAEAPADTTTTTTTTTTAPEPVELARGAFQGLTGHRGSGEAAAYRLADDTVLLRFEDVDIGSGPDLEVYVVPGVDQRDLTDAHHVASLTAERGNQNYALPAGVDLSDGPWTVLVWCETFVVEVANATLSV